MTANMYPVRLILALAAASLVIIRANFCDDVNDEGVEMWHGGCDSDLTALVGINTDNTTVKVKLNNNQEFQFPVAEKGYVVLSLPKTLLASAGLAVNLTSDAGLNCEVTFLMNSAPSGLVPDCPSYMYPGELYTVSAFVSEGQGLIFSFTISALIEGAFKIQQISVVRPCNLTVLEASTTFMPRITGAHRLHVAVAMDDQALQSDAHFAVGYSIPEAILELGPNCTNHSGVYHPSDTINVILTATDSAHFNKSIPPNCTIDWGDKTIVTEEIDMQKTNDSLILYSRNHKYATKGAFTIVVSCINPINQVNGSLLVTVRSPAESAIAQLFGYVLPFSSKTNDAEQTVYVAHKYLKEDCAELNMTFDFGEPNSKQESSFVYPTKRFSHKYTKRGIYQIILRFSDVFGYKQVLKNNIRVGALDFFLKNKPLTVQAYQEIEFVVIIFGKPDNSTLKVNLNFDPEVKTISFDDNIATRSVHYIYNDTGTKRAVASITKDGIKEEVISEFMVATGCIGNSDLFDVTYRSEKTPLNALLSELPIISGWVEKAPFCNTTVDFIFNWQLLINTQTLPVYLWNPISVTHHDSIRLTLTPFIQEPGLYHIYLFVTETNVNQTVNDHMYLKVTQPPIVANIFGGVFTQHSISKPLILDAESVSFDPVMTVPENSNLAFSWNCFMLKSKLDIQKVTQPFPVNTNYSTYAGCSLQLPATGTVTLSTVNFKNGDLVLFEVTASKNGLQEKAVKVVEMLTAQIPTILIECKWNCGTKLVVEDRTVFVAKVVCPECNREEVYYATYQWVLYKIDVKNQQYVGVPWNPLIQSEPDSKSFDSEGGWWELGAAYKINVVIKVGSLPPVTSSQVFFTNFDPYNGTCSVTPLEGIAGNTSFTFFFLDWKDEFDRRSRNSTADERPILFYEVQQKATVDTPVAYYGAETSSQNNVLTACGTVDDMCDVDIAVIDPFKGKAKCKVTIKVNSTGFSTHGNEHQNNQEMNQNIDFIRESMNHATQLGNPIKTAQLAAMFSTVLGSMDQAMNPQTAVNYFTAQNITSPKALGFLLDPDTEANPDRESLSKANHQLINDIDIALARDSSKDINRLRVYTNSLITATSNKNILQGQSLLKSTILASKLSDKMTFQTRGPRAPSAPEAFMKDISKLLDNIIDIAAFDVKSLEPETSQLKNSGLSRNENKYIGGLMAKRKAYNVAGIQKHTPELVEHAKNIWGNMFKFSRTVERFNGSYEFQAKSFSAKSQKTTRENIVNKKSVNSDSNLVNSFSVADVEVDDNFTDVHVEVVKSKNIFTHGNNSKFITSDIFISSVSSSNGTKLNMIAPSVTHDIGAGECSVGKSVNLIAPKFQDEDAALMFYHNFLHQDTNARICITVKPSYPSLVYRMYVKTGSEPTDLNYDYRVSLTMKTLQSCKETCIPTDKLKKPGKVYIGLRPFLETKGTSRRRKRQASLESLAADYYFGITSVACYNWDDKVVDWKASQCEITRENNTVTCKCSNSAEMISAVAFNFAPNSIDFPKVFSKFDIKNQGPVIALLLSIYFLFFLIGCWAHHKDRKGIFQWGIFPLVDNYADEKYFYLITVHTGLRVSSGTKSKVSFCLSGEMEDTGLRQLTDGIRQGFPTASVLHFVMACPKSLGSLQCMRIWHDNSGKGSNASWYLDRIDVTDVQTGQTYVFVCGEWLTPESNTIDKIIETTSMDDLQSLKTILFFNAKKHVTDDHIWMSVAMRPDWSRFSRVDRVGCCVAFLLLAMITSAMFYKGAPDNDRQRPPSDLQIGPIRLSLQQMYNSIISAVVTAIPITAIMMIFRRARTISKKEHGCFCCRHKNKDAETEDAVKSRSSCCGKIPWIARLDKQLSELEKILLIKPDAEELRQAWPHFWRCVSWALVFAVVITCSFFVILYSMEWGRDVTQEWLSSFFLAFLQSLFVVDPFKVILISFLLSIFVKKTTVKGLHDLDMKHVLEVNAEYGVKNKSNPPRQSVSFLSTLTEEEFKAITRKRKIFVMLQNTMLELAIHCIFVIIVCSICYATRSTHDFRLYNKINSDLFDDKHTGFKKVNSTVGYFSWMENVLVPWIFPEKDANGELLSSEARQFTSVWNLYYLGPPRLRQVRMEKEACVSRVVPVSKPCIDNYNIFQEETTEYCLGWAKPPCPRTDPLHVTAGAWYHRSALSIVGPPVAGVYNTYGGGGYIVNLDINLVVARTVIREMKKYLWVDQQTRAVFFEMTVYCPDVNRFVYITMLAEFIETGGVVPYVSIYPFTVYSPTGYVGTYILICQVLYVIFTIASFVYVIFVLLRQRLAALKNFWFMIDLFAVVTSISTASMFHLRSTSAKLAVSKMNEDRSQFMNFQQVVLYDRGFVTCLGFLIAIAFFRLLKLAGYSKKTMRVYYVLKLAVGILPTFFLYICLVVLSFAFLGNTLFGSTSENFKNFKTSMMTLFTGILGHAGFKDTNLPKSDNWETIFFFCLFVIIAVVFLSNLFMAILLDILTISAQRDCDAIKTDEAQIFSLLWDYILTKLRLNRQTGNWMQTADAPDQSKAEQQTKMNQYDQFDRLARIASRLYNDQDGESILKWVRTLDPQEDPQEQSTKTKKQKYHKSRGSFDSLTPID